MVFEKSDLIDRYLESEGKVFLSACPGSGKTTTIAYKLAYLTANRESNFGAYSGIACLSFTNIAKDEINEKFAQFSNKPLKFPHLVSTIDSFINQYITLPYFYLFIADAPRPKIVEDRGTINNAWQRHGKSSKFRNNKNQPLHHSYNPYDIHIELDGTFTFKGTKCNPKKVKEDTFNDYCKALKSWQIREKGILTINDSAYIASFLLRKYPRVARWLAERFPKIVVDEAQDTSEIQLAILECIEKSGLLSLELVGDPYQGLYEWRNAKPNLIVETASPENGWEVLSLNDNRRSHSKIIQCFSIIRTLDEPKITAITRFDEEYPVLVLKYPQDNETEAIAKFNARSDIFKERQVVVRGRALRDKLYGRTYPTNTPWRTDVPAIILDIKRAFDIGETKYALNKLRSIIPALLEPTSDFSRWREIEQELREKFEINASLFRFLRCIPSLDMTLKEWTKTTEKVLMENLSEIFILPGDFNFPLKTQRYKKYYNQPIRDMYGDVSPTEIPVSTIHQVKGMTFDALLLILSANSRGANISIRDVETPEEFPPEKKRMIYVAMSRPRYLLAVGIPDDVPDDSIYERFGREVEIY